MGYLNFKPSGQLKRKSLSGSQQPAYTMQIVISLRVRENICFSSNAVNL